MFLSLDSEVNVFFCHLARYSYGAVMDVSTAV